MADYLSLKGDEKTFEFRLKDLHEYEDITIWKKYGFQDDIMSPDGIAIKFPITSGVLIGIDGEEREIDDLRSLPPPVFKQLYPNMSINKKFTRLIVIQNVEFWYKFTSSANKKLKELITNIVNLGQAPLAIGFKQVFNKDAKTPGDYYKMEIIQTMEGPVTPTPVAPVPVVPQVPVQQPVVENQPLQQPAVQQPIPTPPVTTQEPKVSNTQELGEVAATSFKLNEKEEEVYQAISKIPKKQPLANFSNIMKGNGIVDDKRIEQIYKVKYEVEKK